MGAENETWQVADFVSYGVPCGETLLFSTLFFEGHLRHEAPRAEWIAPGDPEVSALTQVVSISQSLWSDQGLPSFLWVSGGKLIL